MVYACHIFFQLSDRGKYFEMSYDIDISISIICIRDMLGFFSFHYATGSCRLGSPVAPSDPGFQGLLCTTLRHCYMKRSSSVAVTDRPTRRNGPRPNSHSHWFSTETLLPFLPDASAASASPYVGSWGACDDGAGVGWSEKSCLGVTKASRACAPAH